jgi:hypothetical protein
VFGFSVLLFIAQVLEHTDLTFAFLLFCFINISAAAYNAARGLIYPSGAYIFFNALLTCIVGLTYKVFLNEPGESNLLAPNKTMLAYCVLMIVAGFCAALSHRLRPKRVLLPLIDYSTMRYAAIGCGLVGAMVQVYSIRGLAQEGSFSTALHQLNYLPSMGIVFATIYEIHKSAGKRSTNWIVYFAGSVIFFYGFISFSKEGLFAPFITWFLTAFLYGFKFRRKQILILLGFVAVAQFIFVPFAQYGRRSRATGANQELSTAEIAIGYLTHPLETRRLYLDQLEEVDISGAPHLYKNVQGFADRLNMISYDDALIAYTDRGAVYGLTPTYNAYLNAIPHFIWKDKPDIAYGNTYAHEIGVLAEDDYSTGISFSPVGDAYHEATWFGLLFVWPVVIFLYFFITDSLTGNLRQSPYAMLPISLAAHFAPEGSMTSAIYMQTTGAALLIIIAFLCKSVLAYGMRVGLGGERVRVLRTRDFILGAFLESRKPVVQAQSVGAADPPA